MDDTFEDSNIEYTYSKWNDFVDDNTYCSQNNLFFLHVNIRSLVKNFAQLEYIILNSTNIIHTIIVTEVNISDTCKTLYMIDNYDMYSELRSGRKGGGIIIYIHNSIKFTRLMTSTLHFECLLGRIETNYGYTIAICAVYRPPNTDKRLFINELSRIISSYPMKADYLLLGDCNIDLKRVNNIVNLYTDSMSERGLQCCITQHTRVENRKEVITKTCIDHIFARITSEKFSTRSAVITTAPADHYITGFAIATTSTSQTAQYGYREVLDNNKVSELLSEIDWNPAIQLSNPNDIMNFINGKFNSVYNECWKKTRFKLNKRSTCPWKSNRIVNMCKKRDKLFQIWKKDESNKINRQLYNKYRNLTNKKINIVKNNYIKKQVCENFKDPKKVWQIVNRLYGKITQSIDTILIKYFKMESGPLANLFAKEFRKNVDNIVYRCNTQLLDKNTYCIQPTRSMRLNRITEKKTLSIIGKLNDRKSPGIDRMRARDIKSISINISPVITHLINSIITSSIYPDCLKIGMIRPIYKKGSHTDVNNYRPITILPCIDKIVERYFGQEINKYLLEHNIINKRQFGFQSGRSTSQLLSQFADEVNGRLNDRHHVIVVFIDFSKAFETLSFETLFTRMHHNGIQGPLLQWFRNYHENRYTHVCIDGALSHGILTDQGTAQGSIMGPTEYLLYVNDMCNIFENNCSVYQFADDTCLISSDKNIIKAQAILQKNFDQLVKWAHDVGLVINSNKTKLMHISSAHMRTASMPTIVAHAHQCLHNASSAGPCACEHLELVTKQTYLGLVIDSRFNFQYHIDHVCSKLRAVLSKLSILRYKLPYKTLRTIYLSLADSVIRYGISTYGRSFKTFIKQIYRLQLAILKVIVPIKIKEKYKEDYSKLFEYCKVMSVFNLYKIQVICEGFHCFDKVEKASRSDGLRDLSYLPYFRLPKYVNVYGQRIMNYTLPNVLNEFKSEDIERIICTNSYKSCKIIVRKTIMSN